MSESTATDGLLLNLRGIHKRFPGVHFAARQPVTHWGRIDRAELAARTKALLEEVGLAVAVDVPLERLSPAQQQLVEVAKALSLKPKLILFDEPTAAITPAETERLFLLIRRSGELQHGHLHGDARECRSIPLSEEVN
jgi:ABC-type sugar transport system ATPase subunit